MFSNSNFIFNFLFCNLGVGISTVYTPYTASGSDRIYSLGRSLDFRAGTFDICLCANYDHDHQYSVCTNYADFVQHVGTLNLFGMTVAKPASVPVTDIDFTIDCGYDAGGCTTGQLSKNQF